MATMTMGVVTLLVLAVAGATAQEVEGGTLGPGTYAVVATGRTNGTTPDLLGVSLGHAFAGSNWLTWMDRLGANYARLFVNTRNDLRDMLSPNFGKDLSGKEVSSRADYIAAIETLRTPAGHDRQSSGQFAVPIKFREWERLDQPRTGVYEALGAPSDIFRQLRAKGIRALLVLQLTCATATRFTLKVTDGGVAEYWGERWELYKYAYYMGVWAHDRAVENVEIYNEPNLDAGRDGCSSVNATWFDNASIRSEALQAAYSDRQREAPQQPAVRVTIIGPPMSSPNYLGTVGQILVESNHETFLGAVRATYSNIMRFSYHAAGGIGYFYSRRYYQTSAEVASDQADLPVDITEYAVSSAFAFEEKGDTMDDPAQASRLASMTSNLLRANVPRMGVFKFSQTVAGGGRDHPSGVLKNGLMFADSYNAPYDIGDMSLAAEGHSLILRRVNSKQPLLEVTTPEESRSNFTAFGVSDANNYYLFVVNDNPAQRKLALSLAEWPNIPVGGLCIVNLVAAGFRAEVAAQLNVTASRAFQYMQPPNSVVQLVCPKAERPPTAMQAPLLGDATVAAGSYSYTNYGSQPTLRVQLSDTASHSGVSELGATRGGAPPDRATSAALLKFSVGGVDGSRVQLATLRLHVQSSGAVDSTVHVMHVGNSARWNQGTVSWKSAPYLKPLGDGTLVYRIHQNPVDWVDTLPRPRVAGHISVAAATNTTSADAAKTIDVTDSVRAWLSPPVTAYDRAAAEAAPPQNHSEFALLLARLVRRNPTGQGDGATQPDPVGSNFVSFFSGEASGPSAAFRPLLTLYLTPPPANTTPTAIPSPTGPRGQNTMWRQPGSTNAPVYADTPALPQAPAPPPPPGPRSRGGGSGGGGGESVESDGTTDIITFQGVGMRHTHEWVLIAAVAAFVAAII